MTWNKGLFCSSESVFLVCSTILSSQTLCIKKRYGKHLGLQEGQTRVRAYVWFCELPVTSFFLLKKNLCHHVRYDLCMHQSIVAQLVMVFMLDVPIGVGCVPTFINISVHACV